MRSTIWKSLTAFRYYFAQREAVESVVWLYEVKRARDKFDLMRFDASGSVSGKMFDENWPRYVTKMATGAGKTKVLSLLMVWSYFHRTYEPGSELSRNFLLVAPNIIVRDRLRADFDGLKIFFNDPVLPENGHEGRNWRDDFQVTVHIQDKVSALRETENLFLTNIQRVFLHDVPEPTQEDDDLRDYFLSEAFGAQPTGKTTDSKSNLGEIIREVEELAVFNEEAHHIHDSRLAWFHSIQDIHHRLVQKEGRLALKVDVTATPRHNNGAIFVQTVSDYPLVETIHQNVVKHLDGLNPAGFGNKKLPLKPFTPEETLEIVFKTMLDGEEHHPILLDGTGPGDYRSVVSYFARQLLKDLHLVGGYDVLYGKVKEFMREHLFASAACDLEDPVFLRNLSEPEAGKALFDSFKKAINALTIEDTGETRIEARIRLRDTRPFRTEHRPFLAAKKSVFTRIFGEAKSGALEHAFAGFLDTAPDVVSFAKNCLTVGFKLDYVKAGGDLSGYIPDFIAKTTDGTVWIIETKGREELDLPQKMARLRQWCTDASAAEEDGQRYDLAHVHIHSLLRLPCANGASWESQGPRPGFSRHHIAKPCKGVIPPCPGRLP